MESSLDNNNVNCRILMVGLDGAGKTKILYKLKKGEIVETIPTLGYNDENFSYKNTNFCMLDIGGLNTIRVLWYHFIENIQGIIYVIDSSDPSRFQEAKEELYKLLERSEIDSRPLLVYANKQDLPEAVSPDVVANSLDLTSLDSRPWHVQGTSAIDSSGVYEGLDWMASNIKI